MRRIGWMVLLLVSCAAAPSTDAEEPLQASRVQELRTAEAERLTELDELVGHGVIELHWSDESGTHHLQGDLDFWRRGEAISMRIGKFGEPSIWIVGEGRTTTWFERRDEQWTRQVGEVQEPLSVLRLLGLAALPEGPTSASATDAGTILRVEDDRGWTWEATRDPHSGLLQRVALHDGVRRVLAVHRRVLRVEMPGRSEVSWPQVSGLVDLQEEGSDDYTKIDFAWLSTDTGEEPMDRVFDVEYLSEAMGVAE